MTRQPLAPEIEAAIQEQAKYMGICGCHECQEANAEDLREIAAIAVSHTEQAMFKKGWEAGYYDGGEHDCRMFTPTAQRAWDDYQFQLSLSPAPDGSQEER
jgi:hypothetical protein